MSLTNAFDEALGRFKKKLTDKEIASFTATSIEDCWSEAKRIEEDQAARRSLRYMRRIQPYLNSLTQFSQVIEVFIQAKPEIMAFIWGPIKFLIQVASTYTAGLDKLLDAFVKISENLPRFVNYADIFQRNPRMTHILSLIYEDILVFHRSTMKFFKMRAWQQIFNSLWKTFEDSFGTILTNLERHRDLVDIEATAAHISAADQERKAAIRTDKQNQKDRRLRCMRELKEWLVPVHYEIEQTKFVNMRKSFPGTGDWLLQEDTFKVWLDPKSQIQFLWLTGIPGSGKTILASLVTEHTKLQPQGTNSTVFAFLKSGNCEHNSCLSVMRTLIYQLLAQNQDFVPYIYQAYESSSFNSPTSLEGIEDFFHKMLGNIASPYFIIDGLDEIDPTEGKNLLLSLLSIQSKNSNLKIFLSSRSEFRISKALSSVPQIKIGGANMKDISIYTKTQGRQLVETFAGPDPEILKEIEEMIQEVVDRAHGMFLWVRLVIYNLMQQTNLEELKSAVQDLPQGLEQAYGRILKRIDGQLGPNEREQARRILEWVISANRPLELREIEFALSIRLGDKNFVKQRKFLRRLDDLCGPILEINDNGVVDFVHFSAKEYLTSKYSGPFIHIPTAHFNLARTCLLYLSFTCFDFTLDDSKIVDCIYNGDYCLDDYAEHNWLDHVRQANNCSFEQLHDLSGTLKSFTQNRCNPRDQRPFINRGSPHFSNFQKIDFDVYINLVKIYEFQNSQDRFLPGYDENEHPLLLQLIINRVRKNFEILVLALPGLLGPEGEKRLQSIQGFYGVNLFKCRQRTCSKFHFGFKTSEGRDKHEMKHIRTFRCKVYTCPSYSIGFTTEQALEKHQNDHHKEIETVGTTNLENTPTEIPGIIKDQETLFSILKDAIDTDSVALLKCILERGVVINEKKFGKYGMLGYVLFRGLKSTSIARALIEKGTQIYTTNQARQNQSQSALSIASSSRFYDISIIKLLVEMGEDVSKVDYRGLSPLDHAIHKRSYAGVEFLVGRVERDRLNIGLDRALREGFWSVIELLLSAGARTEPIKAGNALLSAIRGGNLEELKAILSHGVDTKNEGLALKAAWDNELWDVAYLLQGHGVIVSTYDAGDALVKAIRAGRNLEELKAILSHVTDAQKKELALKTAWDDGLWDVAHLLLGHGATGSPYDAGDALVNAIRDGRNLEELKTILSHGINIKNKRLALKTAWDDGFWDVAHLLLGHGATGSTYDAGDALVNSIIAGRNLEELKAILSHGIDAQNGELALKTAWDDGLWDVAHLLLGHGATGSPYDAGDALVNAIGEARNLRELTAILAHGVDPESGTSALIIAWDIGMWVVASLILEYGAKTSPSIAGNAMLAAVKEGQAIGVLEVILRHGIDESNFEAALVIAQKNGAFATLKLFSVYSRGLLAIIRGGWAVDKIKDTLDEGDYNQEILASLIAAWDGEMRGTADYLLGCWARVSPVQAGNALITVTKGKPPGEFHGTEVIGQDKLLRVAWKSKMWLIALVFLENGANTSRVAAGDALLSAMIDGRGLNELKAILRHGIDPEKRREALERARQNRLADIIEALKSYYDRIM